MSSGALVTLELRRALHSSNAFCVPCVCCFCTVEAKQEVGIQEETRFTNNTGSVQVAPEKTTSHAERVTKPPNNIFFQLETNVFGYATVLLIGTTLDITVKVLKFVAICLYKCRTNSLHGLEI